MINKTMFNIVNVRKVQANLSKTRSLFIYVSLSCLTLLIVLFYLTVTSNKIYFLFLRWDSL